MREQQDAWWPPFWSCSVAWHYQQTSMTLIRLGRPLPVTCRENGTLYLPLVAILLWVVNKLFSLYHTHWNITDKQSHWPQRKGVCETSFFLNYFFQEFVQRPCHRGLRKFNRWSLPGRYSLSVLFVTLVYCWKK